MKQQQQAGVMSPFVCSFEETRWKGEMEGRGGGEGDDPHSDESHTSDWRVLSHHTPAGFSAASRGLWASNHTLLHLSPSEDQLECIKWSTNGAFCIWLQPLDLLQWGAGFHFHGASVDQRADNAYDFSPVGSRRKHLLITARQSLEVCASLGCWVQLHSVQPRNKKICCSTQRRREGRVWHLLTLNISFQSRPSKSLQSGLNL